MQTTAGEGTPLRWIDVVHPSPAELQQLAQQHQLPATVVEDCLDPEHLPKHERIGDATFLILRVYDKRAPDDASTIQELTRKVAIFYRPDLIITVHRVELTEISAVRTSFDAHPDTRGEHSILAALCNAALGSYEEPLGRAEATLDAFEAGLFEGGAAPSLQQAHHLKRRVSLTRRLLWQTSNVLQKLNPPSGPANPLFQDVRETVEAYLFWADQLLEEVNLLMQVHLAMASHRTNEVMRILTAFSAIFLPLTFIVGVYGMNFDYMPELRNPSGYFVVLALMGLVAAGIMLWFWRRGWLGSGGRAKGAGVGNSAGGRYSS